MNRRVELNRGNRIFLACVYWTFVLYVFVPLLLMILMVSQMYFWDLRVPVKP